MLFDLFAPVDEKEAGLMNVLQLAWIGDAVWEVFVRNHLIRKGLNVRHMHSECIRRVSAKAQAGFIRQLEDLLTPEEAELVRRGRNAHPHHPVPRNQNPEDYAMATGFETLIGFLHLIGRDERIAQLAEKALGEEGNG